MHCYVVSLGFVGQRKSRVGLRGSHGTIMMLDGVLILAGRGSSGSNIARRPLEAALREGSI